MPEDQEFAEPASPLAGVDLAAVEAAVLRALAAPSDAPEGVGLRVLGYGEISLVVGWPVSRPEVACKRLPVFPSEAAAARYSERFSNYLELLARRGVQPVRSAFGTVDAGGGRVSGYVVQPVLDSGELGPNVLRAAKPDAAHPVLTSVVESVSGVVDDRTGLDAQLSNWAYGDGALRYLDVTTPMCFDEDGRIELDIELFLAAYPWALRGVIGRFVAPGVISAYRDPRHVLIDLAANLRKEGLSEWIPPALEVINAQVSPAVTPEEVERYYRSDARLWEAMLKLRRADRWWQRRVRRRDYPFLLPGHIDR